MARRIVYAKNTRFYPDRETALWIDRRVEIDCKDKVFVDRWSGDVAIQQPSYLVGLSSRSFEDDRPTIMGYGQIDDVEDIAWLKQVAYRSTMEGNIRVETPVPIVARIHQLKLRRDGYEGFEVEVLTGDDAKALIKAAKREEAIATLKEVWWLIPIGIGVLWWMF
ncbi:MAG: hypothetical protein RSE14_11745 [Erythrobacter sp.]|jgi:hypothetical protein|uniref:hypothetical protein n=1 Tax=Erythrobacter sp. TaxID=1042 RepID=UPI002B481B0C|nr:hypothetical protein [Erythrobacter sp.]WRH69940.1 MAG: hypothetical protein RSE14_11745 [Erythrobacter sp.]